VAHRHLSPKPPSYFACFSPLAGIASGFILSWILVYLVPQNPLGIVRDASIRLFIFHFGVLGWALGVVWGQERKLHCGGRRRLDEKTRNKYKFLLGGFILVLVISTILLVAGKWILYYLTVVLTMCVLACEIGWGDPWIVPRGLWNWKGNR
jgi:hypothetical protein